MLHVHKLRSLNVPCVFRDGCRSMKRMHHRFEPYSNFLINNLRENIEINTPDNVSSTLLGDFAFEIPCFVVNVSFRSV